MSDYIDTFIEQHGITCTNEQVNSNPDLPMLPGATHWRVTLRNADGKEMTVVFSMGLGHEGKLPELHDVVESLGIESSSYEGNPDFENWADDLGFDSDSRSAERTFEAVKSQALELEKFLGVDAYTNLIGESWRF